MSVNDREFPRIIYKRHKQQHNKNGRQFARKCERYNPQDLRDLARLRAGKIINKIYKISLARRAGGLERDLPEILANG